MLGFMISQNEIERLIQADFPEFKTTVNNLDKSTIVEIRKHLQPLFEKVRDRDGKKWLEFIDELKEKEGRGPTESERDKYFGKRSASANYFNKLYLVKSLISKRSRSWITRYVKRIREEYNKRGNTFFAIDIETFDVYEGESEDEAIEEARSLKPNAYLFVFPVNEKYETILK